MAGAGKRNIINIGEVIYIKTSVPIIGLLVLSDLNIRVIDESAYPNSTFRQEFRYSYDGGNIWSNWITLTENNIKNIQLQDKADFEGEYRYIKDGVNITTNSSFNFINPNYFSSYFFSNYFNIHDPEVLNWSVNVLEKLYLKGITPIYIKRGESVTFNKDEDFIDFFNTITTFHAAIVTFARHLGNFINDEDLLKRFLEQRNIYFCNLNTLNELQYLTENYFQEIAQRGTNRIHQTKQQTGKTVNGELLRLICYDEVCNEFIFGYTRSKETGWNIGNSSPLYKGLSKHINLNKSYEDTKDFNDLSKYSLLNGNDVYIQQDGNKNIVNFDHTSGDPITGIGKDNTDYYIKVNPYLNYEITFKVRQPVSLDALRVEAFTYDVNNNQISLENVDGSGDENKFMQFVALNRNDKYYNVRCIIYNKDQNDKSEKTSLNVGQNLRFKNNVCKILPRVYFDNTGVSGNIYVWDLKMKPSSTNFSLGFIQTSDFILNFIEYNNNERTKENFENVVRRYLLPYRSIYKPIYLEKGYASQSTIGSFNNDFNSDFG